MDSEIDDSVNIRATEIEKSEISGLSYSHILDVRNSFLSSSIKKEGSLNDLNEIT